MASSGCSYTWSGACLATAPRPPPHPGHPAPGQSAAGRRSSVRITRGGEAAGHCLSRSCPQGAPARPRLRRRCVWPRAAAWGGRRGPGHHASKLLNAQAPRGPFWGGHCTLTFCRNNTEAAVQARAGGRPGCGDRVARQGTAQGSEAASHSGAARARPAPRPILTCPRSSAELRAPWPTSSPQEPGALDPPWPLVQTMTGTGAGVMCPRAGWQSGTGVARTWAGAAHGEERGAGLPSYLPRRAGGALLHRVSPKLLAKGPLHPSQCSPRIRAPLSLLMSVTQTKFPPGQLLFGCRELS